MASKAATFKTTVNPDGESDRRVDLVPADSKVPAPEAPVSDDLTQVAGFIMTKKEDDLAKLGFSRVRIGIIRELAERKASGKPFTLSDGNHEMLSLFLKALKAKGLVK